MLPDYKWGDILEIYIKGNVIKLNITIPYFSTKG